MAEIRIKDTVIIKGDNTFEVPVPNVVGEIGHHSRIINAAMVLKVISNTGGHEVKAQSDGGSLEIIDYICPSNGDYVFFNITEELNDIIKNAASSITIQVYGGGITFGPDIELRVEYTPERVMHESNAYYDVDAGRAGNGKINLATGGLSFVHEDCPAGGKNVRRFGRF